MAEFIIHRGSHQIGGICAEVRTEKTRILIDFGANLPDTDEKSSMSDAELYEKVFSNNSKPDAILFTHYHGDHIGLIEKIPEGIQLYIGKTAKKLCTNLYSRTDFANGTNTNSIIEKMETYKIGVSFKIGDISITPLQVGHSALDAYMFLIVADGKRILYTGDFRDHGTVCPRGTFDKVVKKYVSKIDVLVTEGTMFSRSEDEIMSENKLMMKARKIFEKYKYNFVLVSSTNLDSIMSFYHATPREKAFICDKYQLAQMITASKDFGSNENGRYYRYNICKSGIETIDSKNFDIEKHRKNGFVMLVRTTDKFKCYTDVFDNEESCVIYSMWNGYLEGGTKENPAIIGFLNGKNVKKLHTSGHASVKCIQRLIELTNPETIIPSHTERANEMKEIDEFKIYRDKIKPVSDGEIIKL